MEYKDKNLKIIKQQDGSLIEKIGIKETVYRKPFIPFSFEIEEITYSKNIYYNPYGEEIFPVTDEERGLDSYYDSENTERFLGHGKSELSRISLFGDTGKNTFDITIIPMVDGKEKEARGYLDICKEDKQNRNEFYSNSLDVRIERGVFSDLKELYLLKHLKHVRISLNFSEEKDIYHDVNLESSISNWKTLNETEENYMTVMGLVERIDFVTHPQSLPGFKSGEKY